MKKFLFNVLVLTIPLCNLFGIGLYAYTIYCFFCDYNIWFSIAMLFFPVINTLILWFQETSYSGFWNNLTILIILYSLFYILSYIVAPYFLTKLEEDMNVNDKE